MARVIGHEGRHGAWRAFRGLTVLASPEHLVAATGHEIQAWRAAPAEQELVHDTPARGGNGFIDLRGKPPAAPTGGAQAEPAEPGGRKCRRASQRNRRPSHRKTRASGNRSTGGQQ